jgi:hypothetical protein
VPESGPPGFVRGAVSNDRPYRDSSGSRAGCRRKRMARLTISMRAAGLSATEHPDLRDRDAARAAALRHDHRRIRIKARVGAARRGGRVHCAYG